MFLHIWLYCACRCFPKYSKRFQYFFLGSVIMLLLKQQIMNLNYCNSNLCKILCEGGFIHGWMEFFLKLLSAGLFLPPFKFPEEEEKKGQLKMKKIFKQWLLRFPNSFTPWRYTWFFFGIKIKLCKMFGCVGH